jgi:hypothetical protein
MAIIVVGGSGRGVGKTALVCGLITALTEFRWTAVKITSHNHGKSEAIWEETEPAAGQGTDTARYLAAGARRALLITAPEPCLPLDQLQNALGHDANVIFESNRIVNHLEPDLLKPDLLKPALCLGVVGGPGMAIKGSFAAFLRRADALFAPMDDDLKLDQLAPGTSLFQWTALGAISPAIVGWVRARLSLSRPS